MATFAGHTTTTIDALQMHYLEAGEGEPFVLLHGWPQSSHEWRSVMDGLSSRYRLIAPDMRGAGHSGKPVSGYDKRTMALDVAKLMDKLGVDRFHLVGHDFGAAVGFALAANHRNRVRTLTILDMLLPGFGYEHAMQRTAGGGIWHFGFHLTPDLPELLIAGKESEYVRYFLQNFIYDPTSISSADIEHYANLQRAPGALRAGLNYYRTIFEDAAANQQAASQPLTIPVLALGGELSLGAMAKELIQPLATAVEGGAVPRCGHWIPEERPDFLIERLPAHFAKN
jgi:pimeloyl-ACP methyl ester carboxylesterase